MPACENLLLQLLPRADRQRLLARCLPAPLATFDVLGEPGERVRHVHFPLTGFVSLTVGMDSHRGLEVGMVGCEGMLGGELLLTAAAPPWRVVVQGAGQAWRLPAAAFRQELAACAPFDRLVRSYLAFRVGQLAVSAACERFHALGPRLARWLLMSHDRARGDTIEVTHEFLAYMLGVRRVGVTVAAGQLQRAGIITYHRGRVQVLDRATLERESCGCYATNAELFRALVR